jgi:hypothetical protein
MVEVFRDMQILACAYKVTKSRLNFADQIPVVEAPRTSLSTESTDSIFFTKNQIALLSVGFQIFQYAN